MPQPSSALVTLRPDLQSYQQFDLLMDRAGFIGTKVLPVLPVARASGNYGRIKLEQLLQLQKTERGSKGNYARDEWDFDPLTFTTKERGFEGRVDDNEEAVYADYFDQEQITASRVLDKILRAQEVRIADLLFNMTAFTSQKTDVTASSGFAWTNHASATPIDNVETAIQAVWGRTGIWPDTLIIARHTFRDLRQCSQVIDSIRSGGAGNPSKASDVTVEMLARVFDLQKIFIAGGALNAANPGATRSVGSLWDKTMAMVCKTADTNDIREPCIGRTFAYEGDGSDAAGTMETYRDEPVRADIVRARHQVGESLIYTEMGQLLYDVA